jgi:hypothetical protein
MHARTRARERKLIRTYATAWVSAHTQIHVNNRPFFIFFFLLLLLFLRIKGKALDQNQCKEKEGKNMFVSARRNEKKREEKRA